MITIYVLTAISILFGYLRFVLPVSGRINRADFYKDFAHIFVGILFGVALYEPKVWFLFVGLTLLEVVAFFVRKKS